jgi:plasmid stabilization system protein ParE
VGNYRVIYRPKADRVEILNVLHAARRLPPPPFLE